MEGHQITTEEDVLFMDIEKRILLLVNDDEEESAKNRYGLAGTYSIKRPSLINPLILAEMNHFSWRHNECEQLLTLKQRNQLKVWLPRESNGTGVFIPNHPTASKKRCEDGNGRASGPALKGRRHLNGRVSSTLQ